HRDQSMGGVRAKKEGRSVKQQPPFSYNRGERRSFYMPITLQSYERAAAVAYAHRWAYGRNPDFYNYDTVGGDCTNFASQCLLAGGGAMNFTPDFGWYYITANQ